MLGAGRLRVLVGAALAAVVALLAGGAALQLLAGGIRGRTLGPVVLALSVCALGGLIVLHRPRVRLGRVLILTGLGFGLGSLAASALDYGAVHPIPRLAAQAAFATVSSTRALIVAWVLFILWFPDDRFGSRGWRRFFVASVAACVGVALAAWLVGPPDRVFDFYDGTAVPPGAGGPFAGAWEPLGRLSDLLLLLPLAAVGSLVQRYRRGGPVVAQQVRWLLVVATVGILAQLVGAALVSQHTAASGIGLAISIVAQPLPMLAATVAIMRYRLWDIDLAVSRALVYGVLWAALSALLLVPPFAAGLLVGGRGALAAVAIALLVTAVFQPARRRLERVAERLVFRHRARPHVLLTGFWETLRTARLDEVGPLLAGAVHDGLGVRWAGVWLYVGDRGGGSLRPLALSGAHSPGAPVVVSAAVAASLYDSPGLVLAGEEPVLLPDAPAAVVPLVAADELVGVLACGPRRGDTLGAADFELLELLARESALRLRNLRLEAQLRERLAQIEAQADELQRSRRRLVAAQDEERRRIERNLHDGVQQQLVSLAVRLQRASGDDPLLADLAAEAEGAVFALQELARGIFPGVLADQGLAAALRTQAARLPLAVRVEVDPDLAGRRFDPELEAALYFVALEALTNAQKHAPDSTVVVWLRADGAQVALEVVDDGPGLVRRHRSGSGLQNMADRIAAAGGAFSLDCAPGRGTRVAAVVPTDEVLLQADSRR
jgi:signal transduction histidine kinase